MPTWLEIVQGETPETARPIFVTRDRGLLLAVIRELEQRVTGGEGAPGDPAARRALELVRREAKAEDGAEGEGAAHG